MSKKIPCEVIRDLMPSYMDGISSEASNRMIQEHVEECSKCADILADMRTPEVEEIREKEGQQREIDYLKKVKKRNRIIVFCAVLAAVILTAAGAVKILKDIYGGEYMLADIDYHVEVSDAKLCIQGKVPEGFVYKDCSIDSEQGIVKAELVCEPETPFNRSAKEDFRVDYEADNKIKEVQINGDVLWQDGSEICEYAASAYSQRHPYVGDAPSNEFLAYKLGIDEHFGAYTSELQTEQEPFGWKILLTHKIEADVAGEKEKMKSYSFALLALIDNLGSVSWEYVTAEGKEVYTVTAEEAGSDLGSDIKIYGTSAKQFQELLRQTGLI